MKPDKPAYPMMGPFYEEDYSGREFGMTRREVFAKAAMEGLLAHPDTGTQLPLDDWQANIAFVAVGYADALIAELDKEEGSHEQE